jgi:UDP-N-acetyl-D-mannosaminuronic acid transferase (WecB/TagA/CpsF family)
MNMIRNWLFPTEMSPWRYWFRLLLVAVQLVLAYCLAEQNNPFFYQGF